MELVANRVVVESEFRRALDSRRSNPHNTVLLLRAAPEWRGDTEFTVTTADGRQIPVAVAPCATVLAVLDAVNAERADGSYLVVLTPCEADEVGKSVLATALQPEIKPVNRWDLIQEAFGAARLDPALTRSANRWIAEALLDAQPAGGWRRLTGPVLTWATALNRLAATRLGLEDADDSPIDAAALLQWTADPAAVARFGQLRDEERGKLIDWLAGTVGPVASAIFALSPDKITATIPVGLAMAALYGGDAGEVLIARVRAEERYFTGKSASVADMRAFGAAAESLVTRWAATDNGHAAAACCERAESILAELSGSSDGTTALASRSRVLEAGLDARFAALAELIVAALPAPRPQQLASAAQALQRVSEHGRKHDRDGEVRAARDAVRLLRWLAAPEEPPATVAAAANRMLRSWAWADRALASIARAGTSRVPSLAKAYAALWAQARTRRAVLDDTFARKLAAWTEVSTTTSDLLLVENILDRIARPVAAKRLPLIVVLDGMSAAIALSLAEQIAATRLWLEAGRGRDGREPALATVPSVTAVSRTSLLTGTLQAGGQAEERAGFTVFWGRRASVLFHKAALAPEPGRAIADQVRDAIADPETVVAVVLNVIDDSLDKDKPGGPAGWTIDEITYLRPVLEEARRAGRPVILTADHGHVRDQGKPPHAAQSDNARYRSGVPGPGEITVTGPRVVLPGGTAAGAVVAAVDEAIHYTPRKAGYHGGASAAEVVIPVICLFPADSLIPSGWVTYDASGHAPAWWDGADLRGNPAQDAPVTVPALPVPGGRKRQEAAGDDAGALFGIAEVAATDHVTARPATPGSRVAASARMASQRQYVRRAPDDAEIAALIDGLIQAGGRLTVAEVAALTGEPAVRMVGYLALVARLLNVDGYPVLRTTDGDRSVELNQQLLRQQFLGE